MRHFTQFVDLFSGWLRKIIFNIKTAFYSLIWKRQLHYRSDEIFCRFYCCGSESGVWDQIRIRIRAFKNGYISTFLVCVKSHKNLRNLRCLTLVHEYTFRAYFRQKNFQKKLGRKFIFGPDPDVFKSQIRIANTA
jgi:hypothetical protein